MPGVGICALVLWGRKEVGLQVLPQAATRSCVAGYSPVDVGALGREGRGPQVLGARVGRVGLGCAVCGVQHAFAGSWHSA